MLYIKETDVIVKVPDAISEDRIKKSRFFLASLSKARKFNFAIKFSNHFFSVILAILALRFTLQLLGICNNLFFNVSTFLLRPVFGFCLTYPVYGTQHIESEALIGIAIYAFLASIISGTIYVVKEFEKFRYTKQKEL